MPTSHRTRREAEEVLFLKSERIGFFTSRGTVGELDFGGIDLAVLDTTRLHALKHVKDVRFAHTLHVEKLVGFYTRSPGAAHLGSDRRQTGCRQSGRVAGLSAG